MEISDVIRWASYLHTVIVFVGHDDPSLTVAGNPGRAIELTRPGAQRAELMVEGTARLEYLWRKTLFHCLVFNNLTLGCLNSSVYGANIHQRC